MQTCKIKRKLWTLRLWRHKLIAFGDKKGTLLHNECLGLHWSEKNGLPSKCLVWATVGHGKWSCGWEHLGKSALLAIDLRWTLFKIVLSCSLSLTCLIFWVSSWKQNTFFLKVWANPFYFPNCVSQTATGSLAVEMSSARVGPGGSLPACLQSEPLLK